MRLRRLVLVCSLLALIAPIAASADDRMWVGFQDDPSFRWREDRAAMLDEAVAANASIARTTVYWSKIAPRRPSNPSNPFDAAYQWDDLDELVRGTQSPRARVAADHLGHSRLGQRRQGRELRPHPPVRHHRVRARPRVALQRPLRGLPLRPLLHRLERAQSGAVPRADLRQEGQARVTAQLREALPRRVRRAQGR